MISYCLPTRDRPEHLARTLRAIGSLCGHDRAGGAEVMIVDNASRSRVDAPAVLANGVRVRVLRLDANHGAAARNIAVRAADERAAWIVMLDDDSCPLDTGFLGAIERAGPDVCAITADIRTSTGQREMGGLPEVPVGCGVAYRRDVYEGLGGYDANFDYYAEEYDLAARMLLAGWRVEHDPWFRVMHDRAHEHRDMNRIVALLVRNNGWVVERYTPDDLRDEAMERVIERLRAIARREDAMEGFARGVAMLRDAPAQDRTPMPAALYDRFTGLAHAREALADAHAAHPLGRVALIDEGKHACVVRRALVELGIEVTSDSSRATDHSDGRWLPELHLRSVRSTDPQRVTTRIIATMSPGPMADALDRASASQHVRTIAPWLAIRGRRGPDAPRALAGERPPIPPAHADLVAA